MLTGGGKIPANATESLGTLQSTKPTGDLLFDFHHPDIPLPLVVVKRHAKVRHECPHLPFEVTKPEQQVHRGRLLRTTAFFLFALGGAHGNWAGIKARPDYGIIARLKGQKLRRRPAHRGGWG